MRILTILGARPQFIKAAAVSRVLAATPGLDEVLVHTGQHYDANMSDVFFEELGIPAPGIHLGLGGGNHGAMTGRMLEALEASCLELKPDVVMVYGDTNSTLAGALAAAKLHIPVAHVEAGLRSFNRRMPEEVNRVLTDHVSTWLFTPTDTASRNARAEGLAERHIHQVGDVMYDAALHFASQAKSRSRILETLGVEPGRYILSTVHRAENTDNPDRLDAILGGLRQVAKDLPVILPLHPRTRGLLERSGQAGSALQGLTVVDPLGYLDMVQLEAHARIIATDSGGVQKEAFFYQVPCVTLRDETEWVELIELGWNRLVAPTDDGSVAAGLRAAMDSRGLDAFPYGNGDSAMRIASALVEHSA